MGLLGIVHGCGCSKRPRSKICHTYPTMMKLGIVNTLAKEDPEKIWITWHTPWVMLKSVIIMFFTKNLEIQIQILFWYIISNSAKVFWVFKDCFDKNGYNLDDVSNNGNARSSWNKSILIYAYIYIYIYIYIIYIYSVVVGSNPTQANFL